MSKKSREKTRALRRSVDATSTRSKLQRKASRVVESERDLELRAALAKIRADRDRERHDANRAFDKAVEEAHNARVAARHKAEREAEEKRATILKAFAATTEAEAA